MSDYILTQTARDALDFECADCGETEFPDIVSRQETEHPLLDWVVEVECVSCGRISNAALWDRDIEKVNE